jgi:hypothetical protein
MKWTLLLLALALSAEAQSPAAKAPAKDEASASKSVDPKLHADAIKLVEVSGAKQRIQDNFASLLDEAQKMMMDRCPRCTPEFGKEWRRRFQERTNIDDYLDVYARVYEKYFTDAEINELIGLQKQAPAGASLSPALTEKLTSIMPSVLADSVGECSKLGAKLGGEIAGEIEREHPEYLKPSPDEAKH